MQIYSTYQISMCFIFPGLFFWTCPPTCPHTGEAAQPPEPPQEVAVEVTNEQGNERSKGPWLF